jgi:hypothetical protein
MFLQKQKLVQRYAPTGHLTYVANLFAIANIGSRLGVLLHAVLAVAPALTRPVVRRFSNSLTRPHTLV